MEKDNSWWYVYAIIAFVFFVWGFIFGGTVSLRTIWKSLEKAGISRLIHHKTTVDGKVTTNWVEIVWIKR